VWAVQLPLLRSRDAQITVITLPLAVFHQIDFLVNTFSSKDTERWPITPIANNRR
jgi:hypothetical protein